MQYKEFFASVFVILTLCSYQGESLDIYDCGSYFTFDEIQLEACNPDGDACPLYIGAMMKMSFKINTQNFNINGDLVNDVGLYIRGGPKLNMLVSPEDPCSVLQCPLNKNYSATYSSYIYVDPKYPPLSGIDLKWILTTSDEEQLLCFQFPVTLQY